MRILTLDIGTSTGWATGDLKLQRLDDAGTARLASAADIKFAHQKRMDRRLDPRIPALFHFMKSKLPLDWIVFEDVQFAKSLQQVQLWSSFRGAIWVFCAENKVKVECVPVMTLKAFAGNGGADKLAMAKLLCRVDSRFKLHIQGVSFENRTFDDNAVDAIHLMRWAFATMKNL